MIVEARRIAGEERPTFLFVDLDVLDTAYVSAVAYPEIGGILINEFLKHTRSSR